MAENEFYEDAVRKQERARTQPFSFTPTALSAMGLTLFALLKAYAAAKFSLTTAAALLSTAPLNVLLGAVVSYSYAIFPLLFLATIALTTRDVLVKGWNSTTRITACVGLIAFLVSPWSYLWPPTLALLITVAMYGAARRPLTQFRHHRRGGRQSQRFRLPHLTTIIEMYFLAAVMIATLSTLTNLWLPVEVTIYQKGSGCTDEVASKIRNRGTTVSVAGEGCGAVVGHVLTSENGWVTLIRAEDRGLERLPEDAVRYRELCHLSGVQPAGARPMLWVFLKRDYQSPNLSCRRLVSNISGLELDPGSLPPTS